MRVRLLEEHPHEGENGWNRLRGSPASGHNAYEAGGILLPCTLPILTEHQGLPQSAMKSRDGRLELVPKGLDEVSQWEV